MVQIDRRQDINEAIEQGEFLPGVFPADLVDGKSSNFYLFPQKVRWVMESPIRQNEIKN